MIKTRMNIIEHLETTASKMAFEATAAALVHQLALDYTLAGWWHREGQYLYAVDD